MPLDFDPVFHTETMVKILRDQGSTQYAMDLAQLILEKNPQAEGVRRLLDELREESRRAFERFKNSGRPVEAATPHPEETIPTEPEQEISAPTAEEARDPSLSEAEIRLAEVSLAEAEEEAPAPEPVRLTLVPPPPVRSGREGKIRRLEALLRRVQSFRKASDAPQA